MASLPGARPHIHEATKRNRRYEIGAQGWPSALTSAAAQFGSPRLEKGRRAGSSGLTHYGEVALPPGAVVDGEVVEGDVVADALRELWGQAGLRRRTVAVGLASQRVTVRQIDLPDMPEAELADAVRLQAQDQLPIPVDEALLDHVVVGRYPAGNDRQNVRVLLVAAEREMVDRLLTAVTAAKLRPALVDLDAFALVRSLSTPSSGSANPPATNSLAATRSTLSSTSARWSPRSPCTEPGRPCSCAWWAWGATPPPVSSRRSWTCPGQRRRRPSSTPAPPWPAAPSSIPTTSGHGC